MIAIAGTGNNPMLIEVIGGTFYNHPSGTDRPPLTSLVNAFPSLAFDSFITMGVKAVGLLLRMTCCSAVPASPDEGVTTAAAL